jgi:hypothetical protein
MLGDSEPPPNRVIFRAAVQLRVFAKIPEQMILQVRMCSAAAGKAGFQAGLFVTDPPEGIIGSKSTQITLPGMIIKVFTQVAPIRDNNICGHGLHNENLSKMVDIYKII